MRTLVLAVVLCALVRSANAMCGSASPGLSPPSGLLPVNPTIYVFMPHWGDNLDDMLEIKETQYGTKLKYRVEDAGQNDAFHAFRVIIEADAETGPFTVEMGQMAIGAYAIAAAPPVNRAQVTGVTHVSDHWTCSYTEAIELALEGNAIAYRVEWADHTTTVVPPSHSTMWHYGAAEPELRSATQLGHLNCMDHDVDPKLFDKPRAFELYALFADGSTHRIGSAIAQLGEHGVRLPTELVGAGAEAAARMVPGPSSVLFREVETMPAWWSVATGALGGFAVLVIGALAVRRRKTAHVPRA